MSEPDFTEDVNGDFGEIGVAFPSETTEEPKPPQQREIPKGTDDNAAEDRKIFVGGLCWETKEPQLKEYFEKYGEVESVNLKINAITGKSRCFAFVVFKEASPLSKVLGAGEHAINSKKVDVKRAKAKPGKIFIGGLKPELKDEQIREYFSQFGSILEFEMPIDKVKNERKTFGFITFEREETMKELIKKNKVQIGEFEVDLRRATPKNNFGFRNMNADYYGQAANASCGYGYDYYGNYSDYYGGWGPYSAVAGGGKIKNKDKRPCPY